MRNLGSLLFFILFAGGSALPFLRAQEMPNALRERVRESCVEVLVGGQMRGGGAFVKADEESGNAAAKEKLIVTAAHLFINPRFDAEVMLQDGRRLDATVIGVNLGWDIALLKVADEAGDLPAGLPIAAATPEPTTRIFQLSPALRRRVMTFVGEVTDDRKSYTDYGASKGYLEHYFVTASMTVLTSGGAWVNDSGEIVGVQCGRLKDENSPNSGVNLVAEASSIRELVNEKKIFETPGINAWLWEIWTADVQLIDSIPEGTTGLVVTWRPEDSVLEGAGVNIRDVITHCDGKTFTRRHEFFQQIRSRPAGTTFKLTVFNPDSKKSREVEITTGVLEEAWLEEAAEEKKRANKKKLTSQGEG